MPSITTKQQWVTYYDGKPIHIADSREAALDWKWDRFNVANDPRWEGPVENGTGITIEYNG